MTEFWLSSPELHLIQEEMPILPEWKRLSGIILCPGSRKGMSSMCDNWYLYKNFWCAARR